MADRMTIDVDTRELFAAMDAFPGAVMVELKPEAKITADSIAREARARIRRRTGKTAEGIKVEETRNGEGYVVFMGNPGTGGREHVGYFLEFGTKYMTAKPFFFVSARLEEGSHDRRAREAVQRVIDRSGLGD